MLYIWVLGSTAWIIRKESWSGFWQWRDSWNGIQAMRANSPSSKLEPQAALTFGVTTNSWPRWRPKRSELIGDSVPIIGNQLCFASGIIATKKLLDSTGPQISAWSPHCTME